MVRKKIDNETIVILANNTDGMVIHKDDKTGIYVDLMTRNEEVELTVRELRTLNARNRRLLEGMSLVIVDVEDNDLGVMDIAEMINLTKSYKEVLSTEFANNNIVDDIDSFILESSAIDFDMALKSSSKMVANMFCSKAIDLFHTKQFSDYNKMKAIEEFTGIDELFVDVDNIEK